MPEPSTQATISTYFSNKSSQKRHSTSDVIDLTNEDSEIEALTAKKRRMERMDRPTFASRKAVPNAPRTIPQSMASTSQPVKVMSASKKKASSSGQKASRGIRPFPMALNDDEGVSNERQARIDRARDKISSTQVKQSKHHVPIEDGPDSSEEGEGSNESEPGQRRLETFRNSRKGQMAPSKMDRGINGGDKDTPSGLPWTPLELQVQQLKRDNPGTLLLIHEGYKYRFFGDDAKVAAKELGIVCYPKRNFMSASIPLERKTVHLKKLLSQGYRVGIVDQQETAALKKAGDNRNTLFARSLSALYTAATYVDDLESTDMENYASSSFPSLMCIVEDPARANNSGLDVSIGMLSVTPSTGDVIYDCFDDGPLRVEFETRMTHIRPHEMLVDLSSLSKPTLAVIEHCTGAEGAIGGRRTRMESFSETPLSYTEAMDKIQSFYEHNLRQTTATTSHTRSQSERWMAIVVDLPQLVVISLARCIKYLEDFGLANVFTESQLFQPFGSRSCMLLNANTLSNLEIFANRSDFTQRGSLLWLIDHTKTKFGARLLKRWLEMPLTDPKILKDRYEALDELLLGNSPYISKLDLVLKGLPDLAKGLLRIHYKACTPKELATIFLALRTVSHAFEPFDSISSVGLKSTHLNEILHTLPTIRDPISHLIQAIDISEARANNKEDLWKDKDKYPAIRDAKDAILFVDADLGEHLKDVRKLLKRPALQYKTVKDDDFLIEVPNVDSQSVPANWIRMSKTKTMTRYHSPTIQELLQERERHKEVLSEAAKKAFRAFLGEISNLYYASLRAVVNKLAEADCLFSLAQVASLPQYSKPSFNEEDYLNIVEGRHPMAEAIRQEPFVPNSVSLGGKSPESLIITGPNMGGKSSCVRMIALICIMAQVGCYVPAESANIGLLDCVLTRMGASDDIARGRSTFMLEMTETSEILRLATPKSLVILDELGRGTSTFDGMAIASSVLQHMVTKVRCKTLFITHYPVIAEDLERQISRQIANVHMGYVEDDESAIDKSRRIHFLYTLSQGVSEGSFGIECARLAGLDSSILENAAMKKRGLEVDIFRKNQATRCREALRLVQRTVHNDSTLNKGRSKGLDDLRVLIQSLPSEMHSG